MHRGVNHCYRGRSFYSAPVTWYKSDIPHLLKICCISSTTVVTYPSVTPRNNHGIAEDIWVYILLVGACGSLPSIPLSSNCNVVKPGGQGLRMRTIYSI